MHKRAEHDLPTLHPAFSMKPQTLEDVLMHELRDLYSAEKQLVQALPKMAGAANNPDLAASFKRHLEETEGHVKRLDAIFSEMKVSPGNEKCKGMEGLLTEGAKVLEEDAPPGITDAMLISAAQRVEHYEIAGYGTGVSIARLLGLERLAESLKLTLEEEKSTDKKLTALAEGQVNPGAQPPQPL